MTLLRSLNKLTSEIPGQSGHALPNTHRQLRAIKRHHCWSRLRMHGPVQARPIAICAPVRPCCFQCSLTDWATCERYRAPHPHQPHAAARSGAAIKNSARIRVPSRLFAPHEFECSKCCSNWERFAFSVAAIRWNTPVRFRGSECVHRCWRLSSRRRGSQFKYLQSS